MPGSEVVQKAKMSEHEVKKRYKSYQPGDCTLYKIICTCGKEVGGWTIEEAESNMLEHQNIHHDWSGEYP